MNVQRHKFKEMNGYLGPLGKLFLLSVVVLTPVVSNATTSYVNQACTAKIKASNSSPNFNITIDKLATAKGPVYLYGQRSPSKPHRVINNTGNTETWDVELDTTWLDSSGYGCDAIHRVKVDLVRGAMRCEDIKFPYSGRTPSNPSDHYVNKDKGGAVFDIGDLQKAFTDCQADPKCTCR
jgi:hypothetical protein